MTAAAEAALERRRPAPTLLLLCDGDLGASAGRAAARWSRRSRRGECDLAVAAFRAPGRRRLRRRARLRALGDPSAAAATEPRRRSPGQRAMRGRGRCARVLPFAAGYGMEIGMTIDAVRAGYRVARDRARPRAPGHRPHARRLPAPRPPAARLRPRLRGAGGADPDSLGRGLILAIDQGTTGTTCLVFDGEGRIARPRLQRVRAALPAARAGSSTTPPRSGR